MSTETVGRPVSANTKDALLRWFYQQNLKEGTQIFYGQETNPVIKTYKGTRCLRVEWRHCDLILAPYRDSFRLELEVEGHANYYCPLRVVSQYGDPLPDGTRPIVELSDEDLLRAAQETRKKGTILDWKAIHFRPTGGVPIFIQWAHHERAVNPEKYDADGCLVDEFAEEEFADDEFVDPPSSENRPNYTKYRTTVGRYLSRELGAVSPTSKLLNTLASFLEELVVTEIPQPHRIEFRVGPDLVQAYQNAEGASSCMTGRERGATTEIMGLNPEVVRLAVLFPLEEKRAIARALVWTPPGDRWYLDRVYPPNDVKKRSAMWEEFQAVCKREGKTPIFMRNRDVLSCDRKDLPDYILFDRFPESGALPYIDSFGCGRLTTEGKLMVGCGNPKWFSREVKEHEGHKFLSGTASLRCTNGGEFLQIAIRCANCDRVYQPNVLHLVGEKKPAWVRSGHCEQCWTKDFVKVLGGEGYHKKTTCTWSDNLKGWVYSRGAYAQKNLIYCRREKDWFHRDECILHSGTGTIIAKKNLVRLTTKTGKPRRKWVIPAEAEHLDGGVVLAKDGAVEITI